VFSPDGGTLVAAFSNGIVAAWSIVTGKPVFSEKLPHDGVWDMGVAWCRVAFRQDGKQLAWVGGQFDEVRLLGASNGKVQRQLSRAAEQLAVSPDGRYLWAISRESDLRKGQGLQLDPV